MVLVYVLSLSFLLIYHRIFVFCFNDTATTEIYTLSLHDALPIYLFGELGAHVVVRRNDAIDATGRARSEEHTSELQSLTNLVCRLLLETQKKYVYRLTKKKTKKTNQHKQTTKTKQ